MTIEATPSPLTAVAQAADWVQGGVWRSPSSRDKARLARQAPGPPFRLRPAIFLLASMPWLVAGTFAEVFTLCASSTQARWLAVAALGLPDHTPQETVELI